MMSPEEGLRDCIEPSGDLLQYGDCGWWNVNKNTIQDLIGKFIQGHRHIEAKRTLLLRQRRVAM